MNGLQGCSPISLQHRWMDGTYSWELLIILVSAPRTISVAATTRASVDVAVVGTRDIIRFGAVCDFPHLCWFLERSTSPSLSRERATVSVSSRFAKRWGFLACMHVWEHIDESGRICIWFNSSAKQPRKWRVPVLQPIVCSGIARLYSTVRKKMHGLLHDNHGCDVDRHPDALMFSLSVVLLPTALALLLDVTASTSYCCKMYHLL